MTMRGPSVPWALLAPALALMLLTAHFHRATAWPWLMVTLVLLPPLLLRHRWVPPMLLLALLGGTAEWAWTATMLASNGWLLSGKIEMF